MKAVGIKNLKARLSEHLRAVKAGEVILVTERDEVIAELRPARAGQYRAGSSSQRLELLAQTGELRAPLVLDHWAPERKGRLHEGAAAELLEDVRSDRD
jgi:antitoxin (DNA-binding transcriptional repressor) of toxin-antitoxin stability system